MRPLTEQNDENLAVRAEQGDREAVSILVRRHSPRLYGFIQRYHPDRDDCDDLLQETWIRVWTNLGRFDPRMRFSTWLFQIALNLCRDQARREQARSRLQRSAQGIGNGFHEAAAERKADAMRAIEAIEALPLAQKEILLLRYYHGVPEAEAAEILGCPTGTVKSRLHQAIRAVRRHLKLDRGRPEP